MLAEFPDTRFVSVNDTALAVREAGNGDPVVFVHGSVSDLRTWFGQVEALSSEFRAIAYSRRYARPNAEIPDGIDDEVTLHVNDLSEILAAFDAAPAHLVGHSWGALIVLLAAIREPHLVRSAILIEPPVLSLFLGIPPKPREVLELLLRSPPTALTILRFGATVMRRAEKAFRRGDDKAAIEIFGKGVLGASRYASLSAERYRQVWDNRKSVRAQLLGNFPPRITEDEVRSITAPVLLLTGDESPVLFHRLSGILFQLLPNAQQKMIEGASHIVHEDAADTTNLSILNFLKQH